MAPLSPAFRWTLLLLCGVIGAGVAWRADAAQPSVRESAPRSPMQAVSSTPLTAKYLGFQVFIGESDPSGVLGSSQQNWTLRNASSGAIGGAPLSRPPDRAALAAFVQGIIDKIGSTGHADHKLSVIFGPLAFDQTDAEIARVVGDIFDIAIEKNIAVGFHVDDSKFWSRRADLWRQPGNVEWRDWKGTPSTGMLLPWGEPAPKLAPAMCFNSKAIVAAVQHLGRDVIGAAIKRGVDRLHAAGKDDLFAGVIMGWETAIGRDFDHPELPLGYCALTNLGFGKDNPPKDQDTTLESVVHDFIQLWAKSLVDAGINQDKTFGHTAYLDPAMLPQARVVRRLPVNQTYSQVIGFAPLNVTFNDPYLSPGMSYYGENLTPIYEKLRSARITRWASSEGLNMSPDMTMGTAAGNLTMETYLAKVFNHGGALVNIFGWGMGPDDPRNPFRQRAEGPTSIAVYQKFLSGARLNEVPSAGR